MSDNISGFGSVKLTMGTTQIPYQLGGLDIDAVSGSSATNTIYNLPTGVWTSLPTGSVTNISYMILSNLSTASVAPLIISTAATGSKIIATIPATGIALIPWTGLTQLFCSASVVGSGIQYSLLS